MSNLNLNSVTTLDGKGSAVYSFAYEAGLVITKPTTVIRDGDVDYRVASTTTLPYETTGAGMPEGGVFVAVGDAVLRQELADPTQGGELVSVTSGTGAETLSAAIEKRIYAKDPRRALYLSDYGFPTGGDDVVALQQIIDDVSAAGGGEIVFDSDSDYLVSNNLFVKSNITLRWTHKGFIRLTQMSSQGAVLVIHAGSKELPVVENIILYEPRVDAGNFGYPTGDDYGNNALAGTRCRHVRVYGGIVRNAKHGALSPYSTGGTGVNFEMGVDDIVVDGLAVLDCSQAYGSSAAFNTTAPLDFRTATGVKFTDIKAYRCGILGTFNQPTNPPESDPAVMSVTVDGLEAYNCGRGQQAGTELDFGVFVFDRAANVKIGNVNIYNESSYGKVAAVARFVRGEGIEFDNVNLFGECDAIVSHIRPNVPDQYTNAGQLRRNSFDIKCFGTVGNLISALDTYTTGTWLDTDYNLVAATLTGSVLSLDTGGVPASVSARVALFSGKIMLGLLGQIFANQNTFPATSIANIGVHRFNSMSITYGSGSDTLLADGNLNLHSHGTQRLSLVDDTVLAFLPTYADNGSAAAGGIQANGLYKTSTGEVRMVV